MHVPGVSEARAPAGLRLGPHWICLVEFLASGCFVFKSPPDSEYPLDMVYLFTLRQQSGYCCPISHILHSFGYPL